MSISSSESLPADRRSSAWLLITFIVMSLGAYFGLMTAFGFPDILRQPAPDILAAFRAEEFRVRSFYYLFAMAHLIFAAGVLILHRSLQAADGPWLALATAGGLLYGIAQTAGFLRWPMLVPLFAERMAMPELAIAEQETTLLVLDAFHRYAGIAIGENLSFWGLAIWLIGIGFTLRRKPFAQLRAGQLWIGTGLMVAVYTFEQLGGPFAVLAPLLLISHGLMYGLILVIACSFLRTASNSETIAPIGITAKLAISVFCAAIVVPGLL